MDANLKAKWIAALRSGEYKQGGGALRSDDNSYCCLGVLCDIIDPNAWHGDAWEKGGERGYYLIPDGIAKSVLGHTWSGEVNQDGSTDIEDRDGGEVPLTYLNDSGLFTFDQIADVIDYAF